MSMQAHDLVARFAAAVCNDDPIAATRAVLEELKQNLDGVAQALSYLSGGDRAN